jgi:hypothetical protein
MRVTRAVRTEVEMNEDGVQGSSGRTGELKREEKEGASEAVAEYTHVFQCGPCVDILEEGSTWDKTDLGSDCMMRWDLNKKKKMHCV